MNHHIVSVVFGLIFRLEALHTKEKILSVALREFSSTGIKAVTMDQIARLAGMSKKTIYQEFRDKRHLVYEVFKQELDKNACELGRMEGDSEDLIGHLLAFSGFIRDRFAGMHPLVLNEIKRYYPESWVLFERFKEEYALKNLVDMIERGKELGFFRPEINSRLMATMRLDQVSLLFDPTRYNPIKLNLAQIQVEMFEHFLFGIFTEKGREAYKRKMNHQL